ncbi:hypothetical protein K504DRAFT_464528 [Pleomassaria siparia CBS 279.74]|uniref:Uncharacterized protein n=1 Tax=Pleomassaria siparia CBS 279.74 TaxID=1314801 RepID=A0A6G1KHQ2_9PLEO|nr:hypothetical protein K504DRAFT_464528 [Pleomassaria siparia CBS 279.74]
MRLADVAARTTKDHERENEGACFEGFQGRWFVARGSWFVARGSLFVVRGSSSRCQYASRFRLLAYPSGASASWNSASTLYIPYIQ